MMEVAVGMLSSLSGCELFWCYGFFQFYVGEDGRFKRRSDMGANAEACVKRFLESYKFNGTRSFQFFARLAEIHGKSASLLDDPQPRRSILGCHNLIRLFI